MPWGIHSVLVFFVCFCFFLRESSNLPVIWIWAISCTSRFAWDELTFRMRGEEKEEILSLESMLEKLWAEWEWLEGITMNLIISILNGSHKHLEGKHMWGPKYNASQSWGVPSKYWLLLYFISFNVLLMKLSTQHQRLYSDLCWAFIVMRLIKMITSIGLST